MSTNQHRVGIRVLVHGGLQTSGQVLLEGRVLDNGNAQRIEEAQHALALAARNPLDLLDVANLKAGIGTLLPLHQQRHQDGPLRVGVDAAAGALFKSGEEQRRAG